MIAKDSNVINALAYIIGYYGSFKDTLSAVFAADDSIRGTKLKCLEQARDCIEAEIINLSQQSSVTKDNNGAFEDPDADNINEALKSITSDTQSYNDVTNNVKQRTDNIQSVAPVQDIISYF